MEYITKTDRAFIEGKYHKDDGSFNPYNRFASIGHECDETTGLCNADISALLEKLSEETADEPHALAKAKAFEAILDNIRIEVNEHDYFVCTHAYSRLMHRLFVGRWYEELLADEKRDKLINDYYFSGTSSIWLDTEHFVPDWEYIMANGVPGIIEKVKQNRKNKESIAPLTPKQSAFFDSIIIEYEAVLRLIKRLYEYSASHPNEKSGVVTGALLNLTKGAPTNTFEALQLMYIYFLCSEGVDQFQVRSLGNGLDRTLYRFYENDLKTGKFTREQIKTFLAYFLMQFPAIGHPQGHPFYIGGTNLDGSTRVTDLTYDILEVYNSLNIYNPKIQVKINKNTPPEFIERVLEIIRGGNSSFVFVCQPGMVKALMGMYGTTFEEALDADISGCNEMHVRGNEGCMISALPNAAKAVIYTVFNGMDSFTGKRIGLETGDFASFKSFGEVYEAFLKQLACIIDNVIDVSLAREKFVGEINPSIMISGTVERSMDKMEDAYAFGVKYPTSAILLCSFATAVDSLMAIKELVFDRRLTTLSELREALASNWEGYENLRKLALKAKHKFGRDDDEADMYAAALFKWFSVYTAGRKNSRGGIYKVGVPSTTEFISQGRLTEATPDGRKKGEELSKNTQPVNGTEIRGATGYINSALKLQPSLFSEALVLDVMLHPSAIQGKEGLRAVRGMIEAYMKNDGVSIQFNVFSPEQLIDAQAHPEKYKNLQVRVTGWNTLWNDLRPEEQNAYIIRAKEIGG